MTSTPGESRFTGQSLRRKEDPRFLTGRGCFTGDIRLPGMLEMALLRSPHAHARIRSLDASAARALSGVVAVWTADDLVGRVKPFPPTMMATGGLWQETVQPYERHPALPVLFSGKVTYAGAPVAAVVAVDRATAEDACDLIAVEWEPLRVVADPWSALAPDAPRIDESLPDNVMFRFRTGKGDPGAALAQAPFTLKETLNHHRYHAATMETRAVLGHWDEARQEWTLWSAGQSTHLKRRVLAEMLDIPYEQLRCVIPDVGGGFGPKYEPYPEDALVLVLSRVLERPVQWVEDRREHFLITYHGRDQHHEVEAGFDAEGHLLALRTHALVDNGVYNPLGLADLANTAAHLMGPYHIPHFELSTTGVFTNKTGRIPYRGAGRPEAVFVMERVIDRVAATLGIDAAEVRRRNLIPPQAMPKNQGILYRDGHMVTYDSGDYPRCLAEALQAMDYEGIRRRQPERQRQGHYEGIGLAFYVEGTGVGPFEGARVRVDPQGTIIVDAGHVNHGQGHETVLAQLTADAWGVTPAQVIVRGGDSALVAHGAGTYASRSTVTAGMAMVEASRKVQAKVRRLASHLLEAAPEDLELHDGRVQVRGAPGRGLLLRDLARAAAPGPAFKGPPDLEPGLEAIAYYVPPTVTWAYACHIVHVEVDVQTGEIHLLRYVVAHDAGVLVNPKLADGQVMGGVAQGIGGAMYEELSYSPEGQLLSATMMDYLVPTACEVPHIDLVHLQTPSPLNPLGVKGLGEGGAIGPPAAIANALEDALSPFKVKVTGLPLTPERVYRLVQAAGGSPDGR